MDFPTDSNSRKNCADPGLPFRFGIRRPFSRPELDCSLDMHFSRYLLANTLSPLPSADPEFTIEDIGIFPDSLPAVDHRGFPMNG
jgi:hypothetical protein